MTRGPFLLSFPAFAGNVAPLLPPPRQPRRSSSCHPGSLPWEPSCVTWDGGGSLEDRDPGVAGARRLPLAPAVGRQVLAARAPRVRFAAPGLLLLPFAKRSAGGRNKGDPQAERVCAAGRGAQRFWRRPETMTSRVASGSWVNPVWSDRALPFEPGRGPTRALSGGEVRDSGLLAACYRWDRKGLPGGFWLVWERS